MHFKKNILSFFLCLFIIETIFIAEPCLAMIKVGKHKVYELIFHANSSPKNPFDSYLLKLEITDPSMKSFVIDGFFDGDGEGNEKGNIWKARICPYMNGIWSWRTIIGDEYDSGLEDLRGKFQCVESNDIGGLAAHNKHFRYQNGEFTYLQGNFLDFAQGLRSSHVFMGETTSDRQRDDILNRQRDFHSVNKINLYLANKGDYKRQSVTPWAGNADNNDKSKMDLKRWKLYDNYIQRFKNEGILAELWFFADDSGFGKLSQKIKNRLFRYAMARTSAFSNTFYVIALEWGEGWKKKDVIAAGDYIQTHNPWSRLLSVHNLPENRSKKTLLERLRLIPASESWEFSGQKWAAFIATQAGNNATPKQVNELAVRMRNNESIPHLSEEFGILHDETDKRLRANMWANFCGGAAGGGTGSNIKAFMRFLNQSRIPFFRMKAENNLVEGGGNSRFCLAEIMHHYVVYSMTGCFSLETKGSNLKGYWFNPRNQYSNLDFAFKVSEGKREYFPPENVTKDSVLFITDGTNLLQNKFYPSKGANIFREAIVQPLQIN